MSTDRDAAAVARVVSKRVAELGVKQKALAAHAELSTATLRAIQCGYKRHRPTADTLRRLSTALGFAPEYLEEVYKGLRHPESANAEPKVTLEMLAETLNNVAAVLRDIERKLDRIVADIQ